MNDLHAPLCCGLEIDRGSSRPRRGDQAELGQALDDGTRDRRALPHHADDVEWLQARDDGGGVREMVVEYGDARPRIQRRPVRERKSDVLVVVQHGDSEALLLGRHRVPPEMMLSARYQAHWAASQWYAVSCVTTCPIAGNGK